MARTGNSRTKVYYVARGRATLQVSDHRYPVAPGGVFYVAAGVPHRFLDIAEDLTVLVVFARVGTTPTAS